MINEDDFEAIRQDPSILDTMQPELAQECRLAIWPPPFDPEFIKTLGPPKPSIVFPELTQRRKDAETPGK